MLREMRRKIRITILIVLLIALIFLLLENPIKLGIIVVVSFIKNAETPRILLISVLVNLLILSANIIFFYYQRVNEIKLRKTTLKDDFWFRSIAVPALINPVQEFSNIESKMFKDLINRTFVDKNEEKKQFDIFLENFQQELSYIFDRCYIMKIHSDMLYRNLITVLESLEDVISLYCYSKHAPSSPLVIDNNDKISEAPSIFFIKYCEIISVIMNFHDKAEF